MTIVYVLIKNPEGKAAADAAVDTYASAKTEVYFIKYNASAKAG